MFNKAFEFNQTGDYKKKLNTETDDVNALIDFGVKCYYEGNYDEALLCFKRVLGIDPDNIYALQNTGILFSTVGNTEKAVLVFKKILEKDPKNDEAFFHLGNVYNKLNDNNKAIDYFCRSIELNPQNSTVHNNLGVVLGKTGDFKRASLFFKEALRLNPKKFEALCNFSDLMRESGNLHEARKNFEQAFIFYPENLFSLTQLCLLEYQMNRSDIVFNALEKMIKFNSRIDNFNDWLKLVSNNPEINFIIGNLYENQGQLNYAVQYYAESSKHLPQMGWNFTKFKTAQLKNNQLKNNHKIFFHDYKKLSPNKNLSGVSMSSLGLIGRFGNQILQYMNLKLYGKRHNLAVETSDWIGRYLFAGCLDFPISRTYPAVSMQDKNFQKSLNLKSENILKNIDIKCRDFAFPINIEKNEKKYLQDIFRPLPCWHEKLLKTIQTLRSHGNTIVSIHLRRGDFVYENHHFITPGKIYLQWLFQIWNRLDRPVLYLASDDIKQVKKDFHSFKFFSDDDFGESIIGAEFFRDFYILTQSDIVATSYKSTFSSTACMLNSTARAFFQPDLKGQKLVKFDPWNLT